MSERWIQIGRVRTNWFVHRLNAGYPGGMYLDWRGGWRPFQPFEFLDCGEMLAVVKKRLEMARLEMVSAASWVTRSDGMSTLMVLVRRKKHYGKRLRDMRAVPVVA